jgi:hypothetical protein
MNPTHNERTGSPDESNTAHPGSSINRNTFSFPSSNTIAIVSLVIAAILALGMFGLYNRYFVLKMNYDDLKAAMLLHGINPHPHFERESP